jgi:hypothetical protein
MLARSAPAMHVGNVRPDLVAARHDHGGGKQGRERIRVIVQRGAAGVELRRAQCPPLSVPAIPCPLGVTPVLPVASRRYGFGPVPVTAAVFSL